MWEPGESLLLVRVVTLLKVLVLTLDAVLAPG